jgi:flagellar biosynthesis/type III secretory pathway protein FliH
MSKNTTSNNNTGFSYNINNQNNNNQDFTDSINRSLDQTKDNINRSIDESRNQIPHYNTIVNSYQEQVLQATREISEHFIESQKSIINSLHSACGPYQQNFNNTVNTWNSPEAVVNAYSRFVSNVADNAVSAMRTTNSIIFSNLDSMKTVLQHAKDNSKQIFNQNVNVAKTIEQNSKEVAQAAASATRYANSNANTSDNNSNNNNSNTTPTTSSYSSTHYSSSNKRS